MHCPGVGIIGSLRLTGLRPRPVGLDLDIEMRSIRK
jgi:hypothetical protein